MRNSERSKEGGKEKKCVCFLTFSRSGSLRASASSLLSITEAAATSSGVEPRIDGDAAEDTHELYCTIYIYTPIYPITNTYCRYVNSDKQSRSASVAWTFMIRMD